MIIWRKMRHFQQDDIIESLSKEPENFIHCIAGEVGSGKKYTVNQYVQANGLNCIVLKMVDGGVTVPYAPFFCAIDIESFFAVKGAFNEVIGSIKVIGKLQKVTQMYAANAMFKYTEEEQNVISRLKSHIEFNEIDLIFCQDIDKWDNDSKILLEKICTFQEKSIFNVPIISTSSDEKCCLCNSRQIIKLKNMNFENFKQELLRLSGKNFYDDEIRSLYALTNHGNVSLTLYIVEALKMDCSLSDDNNLYNLLIKRITETVDSDKNSQIIEFLKQASLLGYSMLKSLIIGYAELTQQEFFIFMSTLQKLDYMQTDDMTVKFNSTIVYQLISSEASKEIAYKYKLAEFIRGVYPADYEYISYLYENAGDSYNAAIFRSMYVIQYVRDKQFALDRKYCALNLLDKYNFTKCVTLIEKAYLEYYSGSNLTLSTLTSFSCSEGILEFERLYLLSLYYFNNNTLYGMTSDTVNELAVYYTSNEFKSKYLEAWLRCAMLLLAMKIEIKDIDGAKDIYMQVQRIFIEKDVHNTLDAKLKELYYHFTQTSATFMKKTDIAKNQIQRAFAYYEANLGNTSNFSHYFNALVNYTSICLITYDYDKVEKLCNKARLLIEKSVPVSEDNLICIKNNYAISRILRSKYDLSELKDAQVMYEELIRKNANIISDIILKINLCNIYYLLGNDNWHLIEQLYNSINCETEEFYKYYICNNYAMMLYFDGQIEPSKSVFERIKDITPNVPDKLYFNIRNEHIADMLQHEKAIPHKFVNEIDIACPPGVGWSFWGKYLIFSELEQWSF